MIAATTMGSLSSMKVEQTINFIEAVKRHEAIYDTTHQDYKNIEEKAKAWRNIAWEMCITVEAAKRKWKNLRDSYTKYLRSFRVGTKTSRKYQFWAHAEHMDFLRPFQGPGRSANAVKSENGNVSTTYFNNGTEDDLGLKMIEKCYPDEAPISEEAAVKEPEYNTNAPPLENTFDRKTISALRDLDATTMFFLSLAKTVKEMPRQKQATVKMLCMKIVHDVEMDVDTGYPEGETCISLGKTNANKHANNSDNRFSDEPNVEVLAYDQSGENPQNQQRNETNSEQFFYVMSPSRVETMIDISSDEDELPKA